MAPLPAAEWSLPCQNVFEKKKTFRVKTFLLCLSILVFLIFPSSFAPEYSLPNVHPSSHNKASSSSLLNPDFSLLFSLESLYLGEVSACHLEVHFSLKCVVHLPLFPVEQQRSWYLFDIAYSTQQYCDPNVKISNVEMV